MLYYTGVCLLTAAIGGLSSEKFKKTAYFFIFIMLVLMFGLRGDFTADYNNYKYLFNYYNSTSLSSIIRVESAQEIGFVILTKFLSDYVSYQVYLVIIGIIIVGCFIYGFMNESSEPWIALILFIAFGEYFASFNTMRQTIASSILFAGNKYLYSRDFKKYLIFVVIASSMHVTSIIMLLMYFLLNAKIDKAYIIRFAVISFVALIGLKIVVQVLPIFIPRLGYYNLGDYGMTGGSIGYFIGPAITILFIFILYYTGSADDFDIDNNVIRIQLNAFGYASVVSLLTTQAFLLSRFSGFFLPHSFILISNLLHNSTMEKNKRIISLGILLLCLIYIFISLSGSGYDPYYFYWNSK